MGGIGEVAVEEFVQEGELDALGKEGGEDEETYLLCSDGGC